MPLAKRPKPRAKPQAMPRAKRPKVMPEPDPGLSGGTKWKVKAPFRSRPQETPPAQGPGMEDSSPPTVEAAPRVQPAEEPPAQGPGMEDSRGPTVQAAPSVQPAEVTGRRPMTGAEPPPEEEVGSGSASSTAGPASPALQPPEGAASPPQEQEAANPPGAQPGAGDDSSDSDADSSSSESGDENEDLALDDDAGDQKRVWVGTWSHTEKPHLKKPAEMEKAAFAEAVITTANDAFKMAQKGGARRNTIVKLVAVDERHKTNNELHKQFGLLAAKQFVPRVLQQLLYSRHKMVVHFSGSHDYYWTAFIYFVVPSWKKSVEDLDPDPWLSDGHEPKEDTLLSMPPGAAKADKLRVRKFLGLDHSGRPLPDPADRELTFVEFSAVLTAKGLRGRGALLAWIQSHHSLPLREAPAGEHPDRSREIEDANDQARVRMTEAKRLNTFVHRHIRDLNERIALAWELHDAVEVAERAKLTAWETVERAATKFPCVCEGQWIPLTEEMLEAQVAAGVQRGVDPAELPHRDVVRAAMVKALKEGCAKHTNVFFVGPPNAAKTHVVAPLVAIFGKDSFRRPLGKTNYPMMDIHGKKVCVLEDLRAATFGLSWDAYLVWWEGLALPVPMPQNQHKGPKEYTDKAATFATGGDKLRIPLREALDLNVDPAVQNSMMDKRWVYFVFSKSFDGAARKSVRACPACFAMWLTQGGVAVVDFF